MGTHAGEVEKTSAYVGYTRAGYSGPDLVTRFLLGPVVRSKLIKINVSDRLSNPADSSSL